MKQFIWPLLGLLFIINQAKAQDSLETITAASGDGIFSLLRKQGINPAKYYEEFLMLNQGNIKNGSELFIGRDYLIPHAPDSFKNMGRLVNLADQNETAIFKNEFVKLNLKSDKLKNAVYYLISENNLGDNKFTDDITLNLARQLLINGARVYLIVGGGDDSTPIVSKETATESDVIEEDKIMMKKTQSYVEVINKRYLKYSTKYQRLLVVRSNGLTSRQNLDVSIFHHDKSEEGQKFAENIEEVFLANGIKSRSFDEHTDVFADKNNLFLAKNILAPITIVEIGDFRSDHNQKKISVRSDKKALAKWLTSGLFKDYADLEIEE